MSPEKFLLDEYNEFWIRLVSTVEDAVNEINERNKIKTFLVGNLELKKNTDDFEIEYSRAANDLIYAVEVMMPPYGSYIVTIEQFNERERMYSQESFHFKISQTSEPYLEEHKTRKSYSLSKFTDYLLEPVLARQ